LVSLGIDPGKSRSFKSNKNLDSAARDVESCQQKGYTVLTLEDKNYPGYLRETFDPPFVLYCAGHVEALKEPAVSIVGARKLTSYGRAVADRLARDLASCGLVIVSGMARGIDSLAHWGALKEGRTVAVLGSGLDNIYPRENKKLYQKIMEEGAVISEFPLTAPPLAFHFPQRNRIISGLSLATLVVEATKRSGSLITARLALEQDREVMAVPGNITSDLSAGTNWLIKTGAKAVETWEDVVEEFPSPLKEELLSRRQKDKEKAPDLNEKEKRIMEFLSPDKERHIDELLDCCGFAVSEALAVLLNLELKGLIIQLPGKYFQRNM
jgi:DNA processing protein